MTGISQIADTSQLVRILRTPAGSMRATDLESDTSGPVALSDRSLNIGLIDCYRFSQDCLIKAFDGLDPRPTIVPFERVQDCISTDHTDLDVVVYYSHAMDGLTQTIVEEVSAIRQAFSAAPIIVLSDAEDADHPNMIRSVLKYGAQGFIPTRTTGIPIAFAAIRFITAGGVFAPLDLLLTKRPDPAAEATRQSQLTPRQSAVLNQLQQGKANKIIAHELGMSESTVKVHVRNIMRKTGATNRTQAAYKAQKLWGNRGLSTLVNADAF
jgi:DNA-binding NarL/FixJ family response regulator